MKKLSLDVMNSEKFFNKITLIFCVIYTIHGIQHT